MSVFRHRVMLNCDLAFDVETVRQTLLSLNSRIERGRYYGRRAEAKRAASLISDLMPLSFWRPLLSACGASNSEFILPDGCGRVNSPPTKGTFALRWRV